MEPASPADEPWRTRGTVDDEQPCSARIFLSLPLSGRVAGVRWLDLEVKNEIGEWSTYLGFAPSVFGRRSKRLFFAVQDSTMFVPAAVGYPLFLLQPSRADGVIGEMLDLARRNIARYRRGDAYNFWLQRPPQTSRDKGHTVTYPHNIPAEVLEKLGRQFLRHPEKFAPITDNITGDQTNQLLAWTQALFDPRRNPHGVDSAFNIPNDADDTSTAVSFELLYRANKELAGAQQALIHTRALEQLQRYRDLGRNREDGHDTWKGIDSGAFLTWFKDEDEAPFARPGEGVIPRAVNNVDCVVNANALLALSLGGRTGTPGFADAAKLLARAISEQAWPNCGLYYPQKMIFPYTISRALRDGRLRTPELFAVRGILMQDVLNAQAPDGHFDGGLDGNRDLATALAVVTLLNLGEQVARDAGINRDRYARAIRSGLRFLHDNARSVRIRNPDTFARPAAAGAVHTDALSWKPGIFFASTFWGLVEWRSEAYTTAIVLEAFSRYALAFDLHAEGISGKYRLGVDEATFNLGPVHKM